MSVRLHLKEAVLTTALVLSMGIAGVPARAAAASPSAQEQMHEQDYTKNKNYQQGMRDGQDDRKRKLDHSRKRKFKKDEDQKAYEVGYQHGHEDTEHR